MPRFFVNQENVYSDTIKITGDDVKHIKNVLRSKSGDTITLCDCAGKDYLVRIEKFETDYITTAIVDVKKNITEAPVEVILFQGLPKSDKMDFIIQKSVELGVNKIVPVIMERTVVRIDSKKDADNKVARWQRISLEASKQSNRGIIPQIGMPVSYKEALDVAAKAQVGILPYEKEVEGSLKSYITKSNIREVAVMIGPEGGFSEKEVEEAVYRGIKPVTLGPRILRTETAGIAVLSIIMYELGDINK